MAVRAPRLHSAKPLTLSRGWASGYHGQPIAFVDQSVLFYAVDDGLRFHDFLDKDDQQCTTLQANGTGVGVIAGNADMHVFAYADYQRPPVIHLCEYPSMNELKQFTDGGELEYSALAFSTTDELLSLSSAPDYLLTVWNWRTGTKLAQCQTTKKALVEISFNPNSWYEIGILYRDQINFYTCERRNEKYNLFEKRLLLELFNQTIAHNQPTNQQVPSRQLTSSTKIADVIGQYPSRFSLTLVDSTIGIEQGASVKLVAFDTENEEAFQTYLDKRVEVVATSFCWGDKGYVFIGTADDSLIQVLLIFSNVRHPFRATSFADDEAEKRRTPLKMFNKIRLHRQGLFCTSADNTVRLITLEPQDGGLQEATNVNDIMELSSSLTNVAFNQTYDNLFVCSMQGIDLIDLASAEQKPMSLIPTAPGKIVDLAILSPASELVVTARDSGALETWSTSDGARKHHLRIEKQTISHMVAHPVLPFVVVTSTTGFFYFFEVTTGGFRPIHRIRVHSNDVRCLKFNARGNILVSVGIDNSLFMMEMRSGQASAEDMFHIVYRTDLDGEPFALDLDDFEDQRTNPDQQHDNNNEQHHGARDTSNETRVVVALTTKTEKHGRFLILDFDWQQYRETRRSMVADNIINDASNKIITKTVFAIADTLEDFLLIARNQLITLGGTVLRMYRIPDEAGKDSRNRRLKSKRDTGKLTSVEPLDSSASLPSAGGHLYKNKAIPSCILVISRDGVLSLVRASSMAIESSMSVHSFLAGGCHKSAWSADSKYIASVAENSSIVVFQTKYGGRLMPRTGQASEDLSGAMSSLADLHTYRNTPSSAFETISDRYMDYKAKFESANMTPPSPPREDFSWTQLKEYEATLQNLDTHLGSKVQIRTELERIRKDIRDLMAINDKREDKAQLDRREFDLDAEEQERQRKERDAMIVKKREETITENLRRLMKREVIKQQHWDAMAVKGRCIESIVNPNRKQGASTVVENYPLVPRSLDEVEHVRHVIERRRIEIAEKTLRRKIFTENPNGQGTNGDASAQQKQAGADYDEEQNEQTKQSTALIGSVCNEFQVDSSVLYDQFEMFTQDQKWTQIALLNDLIYKIKEAFNKEFENVHQRKLQELGKIRERNTRIKQINSDLDDSSPVWEPDLTEKEKPQLLFEVKDTEIKAERYYTPEQLRQLEEQRLNEERRRELERLDNWRERGLNDMMNGVLQVRREDELKKEIPKPDFVLEKAEEDWTDLEKQAYQQYLQKVKEQQDEREKLRKVLTAESAKINEQIYENCQAFEQVLSQLHRRRITAQTAVLQEELKISRLTFSLVKDRLIHQLENAYEEREKQVESEVQDLELSKRALEDALVKVDVEKRRLKAEDTFEKQFPREFADVPSALQDSLKRLLIKRSKMKQPRVPEDMNPYSARQTRLVELELDRIQAEADGFTNAPPNIIRTVWERFIDFRRKRIELERQLRLQEQEETMIKSLRSTRDSELTRRNHECNELQQLLIATREAHIDDVVDLYMQLVLKQGQVEIEPKPAEVPPNEYRNTDVELIHRREVEDLNTAIIEAANYKIRQMDKTKGVTNDTTSMSWEKEKLIYEIADLKQRAQDITFLKVTRNIQEYLTCPDDAAFESLKQRESQMLEATIEKMKDRFDEQHELKEHEIDKLQHDNLRIANVTMAVDEALQGANVTLYERRNIIDQRIIEQSHANQRERMQQVVRRRRLVDLAKAQAQEVAYLRAEVERLRMKTFPALVQIEH